MMNRGVDSRSSVLVLGALLLAARPNEHFSCVVLEEVVMDII